MAQHPKTALGLGVDLFDMYWTMPFRALGASDAAFKEMNRGAELYAVAARQAGEEAARNQILPSQIKERIADLVDSPTEAMLRQAREFAEYNTYTAEPGKFARDVMQLRNSDNPYARAAMHGILPFWLTPSQVFKYSFEHSPLALLSNKYHNEINAGGARADLARAKLGLGTLLMMTSFDMAMDGWITGPGPGGKEFGKAQLDQRSGVKPFALKTMTSGTHKDGTPIFNYIPLSRLDPIATPALWGAAIAQGLRDSDGHWSDNLEKAFAAAVLSTADIMMNKATMQGFANLMRATMEPGYGVQYLRRQAATAAVPASVNWMAKQQDPVIRSTWDIMSAMQARIPGMSKDLPPSRDFYARERTHSSDLGWPWSVLIPTAKSTKDAQPIDREMKRLALYPYHQKAISIPRSAGLLAGTSKKRSKDRLAPASDALEKDASNMVPLRDNKEGAWAYDRLVTLTAATPASQLVKDNAADIAREPRQKHVIDYLNRFGDRNMREALNDMVQGKLGEISLNYERARDDQKREMIQAVVGWYRKAAQTQVRREFPILQKMRDEKPRTLDKGVSESGF
jgi:hypothetical protein